MAPNGSSQTRKKVNPRIWAVAAIVIVWVVAMLVANIMGSEDPVLVGTVIVGLLLATASQVVAGLHLWRRLIFRFRLWPGADETTEDN